MKKLWIATILGILFLGSCAQNKEKREEYKDAHDKDSLRNRMGDSAVANSEPSPTTPNTSKAKADSAKTK
ncbi:hypothetical protein LF887_16780 [Chryseobacterium sp. MEBOG06]|uniref:hypothetical protein n=1 Tax=unclassified Chryseobacterium TaxID=2593645 RepID=UPI001F38801F|nr:MULTISPECIES: hypothetical protein [unclassified Chryseobacterium]UKB82661.1 hypothetical protein LF887_16780 [Chryseobacterium sp. MEBOG06]